MNKSYRFARLCFGLPFAAILFLISLQFAVAAQSPACGQFSLENSNFFRISSQASTIVTADFNNDGIPDVAAPMPNTNSIAVALGDNQTGFGASRDFVAGVSPQDLTVGDFNRDGEIDLAVTSATDRLVNILLGDGAGNFNLTDSYPVGIAPNKVVNADFNSDGWLDLVVGNIDSKSFSVYLGGASGFVAANPATIALNGSPYAFAAQDFNRDGKVDLITVAQNSFGDSFVRLFNGDGQGGFTGALTLTVGELYILTAADFNNDNYPDFATYGYRDAKVRVYLNNQQGGFNAPIEILATWGSFQSLVAGDLNQDGKIDLMTGGFVLLNDGNANFTLRERSNATGSVLADFNGDGIVDLASAGGITEFTGSQPYSTFSVSYGVGDAKFKAPTYLPPLGSATSMVTADFNNDGRQDVAAASPFQNQVKVSFQNADGTFTLPTAAAFSNGGTSNGYSVLTTGDFNGDGNVDLATNLQWARSVFILTNNGSGQFTVSSVSLNQIPFGSPSFIQSGDFNNDGKTDLVVTSDSYVVLINNGSGGFTPLTPITLGTQGGFNTVAVGDFNADGIKDLAITRAGFNLSVLRGNGDGSFVGAGSYPVPSYASMVRSADLNSDNRTDLIVTTGGSFTGGSPGLSVLIANANGIFTQTNYPVSGAPNDVSVGDFDGDSVRDFLVINSPNNAVTLFAGNGSGGFTAQSPVYTLGSAYSGAAADFNQDQKLDLALGGRFGPSAVFYNNTAKAPCLAVNDVQVTEGDAGTTSAQFTVSLSAASAQTVAVDYRLVGRSARVNSDFDGINGRIEFAPGTQTQNISVPVRGDTRDEIDETFQIVLSNPANASLADAVGVGTINDNDAPPTLNVGDVSVIEGSGGNPPPIIMFNVSLSAPTGRKAKIAFTTLSGTATAGEDFIPATGTIVFNADEASKPVFVQVNADFLVEPDETFKLKLSNPSNLVVADDEATGTILNDDVGGTIQFETAIMETAENNESVVVSVRRTGGNAGGITLDYSTSDGTATANRDYLPSAGQLVFGANETVKTFIIPILEDAIDENPFETVNVTLANIAGGAVLGQQSTATLNIADDDPAPLLTLDGTSVGEGNSGTRTVNFNVRLLAVSERTVSVTYITADGTANAPSDYQSAVGTLTFAPGETSKTVSVLVNGDTQIEPNETFFLNLSNPINAQLQSSQAVATIVNDDFARRARSDFDGDGKTDVSVFRPGAGDWYYLQSSDNAFRGLHFGANGDRVAPSDFDGDSKTDLAVFRPSDGTWYILESQTSAFRAVQFGASGDKPVAGDYDGDGKSDVAVFRPADGVWYILRSSDSAFTAAQFGIAEDKPAPADYDGDGKTDLCVFRPSNGSWYRINSAANDFVALQFGISEDKPVSGDYDGDGRTDIAVFRPSDGVWYLLQSTAGFNAVQWGNASDQPAPGDYDGDGKSDFVVFRAADGNWYLNQTSGGQRTLGFGAVGDIAVPGGHLQN